jgi:hypothetical protein
LKANFVVNPVDLVLMTIQHLLIVLDFRLKTTPDMGACVVWSSFRISLKAQNS